MSKYEKDDIVTGYVTGIVPYGIFVSLDDYYDGLIHVSEISDDYVKNIFLYANIGDTIKSKVLDVNEMSHRLKLSIKNIDYKNEQNSKIKPTKNGFNTLESKLPIWINEKINEINNKNM